ncbi:MAG: hypothetical protein ABSF44_14235 [Candidatus Bathyarchaeia archaeon]|jgi:hypothetical protein
MRIRAIIIIALMVIAPVVGVLLAINLTEPPSNLSNGIPGLPSSYVLLDSPSGYFNGTKLFLVSAKYTYGTHNGQACFIIYATVRNDYTAQQPPPMDNFPGNSSGTAYFGLTAKLYGQTGLIAARDVTSPGSTPLGVPEVGLDSGQTYTYQIDMATSNARANVDNYSIDLVAIAGYPIP